jgi:hypothetical protein
MHDMWLLYEKMDVFNDLCDTEKQTIIDAMLDKENCKEYSYGYSASKIINQVDVDTAMAIFNMYLDDYKYAREDDAFIMASSICERDPEKRSVFKKIFLSSKRKSIQRGVMLFGDLTIDEETAGLRSLSANKHVPKGLYNTKYKPHKEALEKLPPIMRLNVLESLAEPKYISYNIFENICEQDFKNLLFGSVVRYRDRVEQVCEKYTALCKMGNKSTIKIILNCPMCGEYDIVINSKVLHTEQAITDSRFNGFMRNSHWCCICSGPLTSAATTIIVGNE